MTHQRNIAGLRASAKQRHENAVRRAEEAIQTLLRERRPITFRAVAAAAQVSSAWLYQNEAIKARIQHLREQTSDSPPPPPQQRASDASKDAMLTALRQRVKKLEEENRELRQQIEVAYGQLYKGGQF